MPINAMIPLSGTKPISPLDLLAVQGSVMQNQLHNVQLQQAQYGLQGRNAMLNAFSTPGALGPDGQLSSQAMSQAIQGGADPKLITDIAHQQNTMGYQTRRGNYYEAMADKAKLDNHMRIGGLANDVIASQLDAHAKALQAGASPETAMQTANQVGMDKATAIAKSSLLGDPKTVDEFMQKVGEFDPVKSYSMMMSAKDLIAQHAADSRFAQQDSLQANRDASAEQRQANMFAHSDAMQARSLAAIASRQAAGSELTPGGRELAAQLFLGNGVMPGLGQGRAGTQARTGVMNRAAEVAGEQGQTGADVLAGRAGLKADTASITSMTKMHDAVKSFSDNAAANGQRLITLADKVDTTGVPIVEKWIRAGRQATGDPDVAAFNAQMTIYRNEVAKILTNPNLTGVLTVEAQREAQQFLGGGSNPAQIRSVVGLLSRDAQTRERTLKAQISEASGRISKKPAVSTGAPAGSVVNWSDLP